MTVKQSSIGIFIRDSFNYTRTVKIPWEDIKGRIVDISSYRRSSEKHSKRYPYEVWEEYNLDRQMKGYKGITYENFWRYWYVLERLGLVARTSPPVARVTIMGEARYIKMTTKPDRSYKNPDSEVPYPNQPPCDWNRVYYRIIIEKLEDPAWSNPYKYYRMSIGSEKYFGSEEAKAAHKEELAQKRELAGILKLRRPRREDTVPIRISKDLKAIIDRERGERTVNEWLTEQFTVLGYV